MVVNPHTQISDTEKKLLNDLSNEAVTHLRGLGWTDEQIAAQTKAAQKKKARRKSAKAK